MTLGIIKIDLMLTQNKETFDEIFCCHSWPYDIGTNDIESFDNLPGKNDPRSN
jgi:hypothetical protein